MRALHATLRHKIFVETATPSPGHTVFASHAIFASSAENHHIGLFAFLLPVFQLDQMLCATIEALTALRSDHLAAIIPEGSKSSRVPMARCAPSASRCALKDYPATLARTCSAVPRGDISSTALDLPSCMPPRPTLLCIPRLLLGKSTLEGLTPLITRQGNF